MYTETIDIPTPDGTADAYIAHPGDGARHPGVLFYMDAIGLRPNIHEMAERLASEGYFVLAPNVFYRHGRAPVVEVPDLAEPEARAPFFQKIMPMVHQHGLDRVHDDAAAFLDYLASRPEVRPGPVGTVGYCMGGVLAIRTAAAHPDQVKAAAAFHPGGMLTDADSSPHRLAPRIGAEVVLGLAESDYTDEQVGQLADSLDSAGLRHSTAIYPGTVHGFTMADTAAHHPEGEKRHWDELLDLFARNLKGEK
ncbi:MAG TPA: dienelactone hydrolase family protein [Stackebrandtia sp.]|jgi:carboxymethylenebutenolidase|uniref:dienelactone hydrolase family protein n=1 Tax=Stackebrandtia sp. TaxID=2023065 RepID=UPI002D5F3551|nr:dienelactone hydrolase family protein [Stackebrandtia sp.]HZE37578.1 dienelactone hydrolase family protein [Stackebrandtia sp.]